MTVRNKHIHRTGGPTLGIAVKIEFVIALFAVKQLCKVVFLVGIDANGTVVADRIGIADV